MSSEEQRVSHILGLGLDNSDGHTRLTRGDGFTVAGGSAETHERMAETLIHTQEELTRKGRSIQNADPREVRDLLDRFSN